MLNDDLQDKLNKMEKMTDHYQVAYCTGVSSGLIILIDGYMQIVNTNIE